MPAIPADIARYTIILWIASAILASFVGSQRDRAGTGFLLGAIFGPLGFLASFSLRQGGYVCPFCRTHVPYSATVCHACHAEIETPARKNPVPIILGAVTILAALAFLIMRVKSLS